MTATGYSLTCRYLGFQDSLEISQAEFEAAQGSKLALTVGLGVEEKFDIVLENHADLEGHLLTMALEYSLFRGRIEELLNHGRRTISRRMSNYLAAARLYIDQVQHDIAERLGKDGVAATRLREVMSLQYDSRLGYRTMEALRNHAQHRGLPVHAVTFPAERDERFDPARFRFGVVPSVGIPELKDDRKFKKSILSELEKRADKNGLVPLMPLLREHSEGIGNIHTEVRSLLAGLIQDAERLFADLKQRAIAKFGEQVPFLAAVKYNADGTHADYEYITDAYSERRRELEEKNSDIGDLVRRYVSSE